MLFPAMGSPLGLTLINAFLCHFEKQWRSDFPQDFCGNTFRKYVDDIFVTFNSHEQLKKFVDYMNTKHSNIKFTFELNIIILFHSWMSKNVF